MPHTYSGNKRNKRPDFRPNGKRRLKALQVTVEKDRLARVAANELKAKGMSTIPRHEKLAPITAAELEQQLKKKKEQETFPEMKRYRALLKLLRQIVVLEEKRESGVVLNDAQIAKVNRFDGLAAELEELQQSLESSEDEDDEDEEGEDDESDEEADEE
jgi:hypothetical protein